VVCVFRDPDIGIGIGMYCMELELGSECPVERNCNCNWSVSEVDRVGCLHEAFRAAYGVGGTGKRSGRLNTTSRVNLRPMRCHIELKVEI